MLVATPGEVAFESEPVTDIAQTEDWWVIVGMGAAGLPQQPACR